MTSPWRSIGGFSVLRALLAACLAASLLSGCASAIKETTMYPTVDIEGTYKAYLFGAGEGDPHAVAVLGKEQGPYKVVMEAHGAPYRVYLNLSGAEAVTRAEKFIGTAQVNMKMLTDDKGQVIGYILLPSDFTRLEVQDRPTINYKLLPDIREVRVSVYVEFSGAGRTVF